MSEAFAFGINEPKFKDFIRAGQSAYGGSIADALKNPAVHRCVTLISGAIGMLPAQLVDKKTRVKQEDHPLCDILEFEPNDFQTPFQFKQQMQAWMLTHGYAVALKIKSLGRVLMLIPINPDLVRIEMSDTWKLRYHIRRDEKSKEVVYSSEDVLHLMAFSFDGMNGLSIVKLAALEIELAKETENAALRAFKNGMMVGGYLQHPTTITAQAHQNLQNSLQEKYQGSDNSGKWMILEEGMKAEKMANSLSESQHLETANRIKENLSLRFGVPRPFLNLDDTSWGSGIVQLMMMFRTNGLAPYFTVWEEALARSCLTKPERRKYAVDFDERELLRGSPKEQAEFMAKAAGSGGHKPWMTSNELREYQGLGPHPDGDKLEMPGATLQSKKEPTNEPA
jgi:HK97 family phage portal protein